MVDEHAVLALLDLLGSLGSTGTLVLAVALLVRGDIIPRSALRAIVAETVAQVLSRLEEHESG